VDLCFCYLTPLLAGILAQASVDRRSFWLRVCFEIVLVVARVVFVAAEVWKVLVFGRMNVFRVEAAEMLVFSFLCRKGHSFLEVGFDRVIVVGGGFTLTRFWVRDIFHHVRFDDAHIDVKRLRTVLRSFGWVRSENSGRSSCSSFSRMSRRTLLLIIISAFRSAAIARYVLASWTSFPTMERWCLL